MVFAILKRSLAAIANDITTRALQGEPFQVNYDDTNGPSSDPDDHIDEDDDLRLPYDDDLDSDSSDDGDSS